VEDVGDNSLEISLLMETETMSGMAVLTAFGTANEQA